MTPPSRRRILITTDTVGGVWTYATTLARALARRRCDVVLVTVGPPPRPEQLAELIRAEEVVLVPVRDLVVYRAHRPIEPSGALPPLGHFALSDQPRARS